MYRLILSFIASVGISLVMPAKVIADPGALAVTLDVISLEQLQKKAERIDRERVRSKRREVLVKWLGEGFSEAVTRDLFELSRVENHYILVHEDNDGTVVGTQVLFRRKPMQLLIEDAGFPGSEEDIWAFLSGTTITLKPQATAIEETSQ